MRELKFRVWDGKVIVDLNRIEQYVDITTKYQQDTGVRGVFGFHIPLGWTLMQFTGLKDKKGKEIYEGDIVGNISNKCVYVVVWHGNLLQWYCVPAKNNIIGYLESEPLISYKRVVLGNIYQTPELLKK